jgi:hypothetical protein
MIRLHPVSTVAVSRGAHFWSRRGVIVALAVILLTGNLDGQRAARFDADGMLRDLALLSADDMEGRRTGTPGAAKARALLIDRFSAAGLMPVGTSFEHAFTAPRSGARGINLVGQIQGRVAPGRYIVVSAHYDHIGVNNGRVFNGANDNASGAAALAAIAGYFVKARPATSLLFVAFDAEEAGLVGSRAFVRAPPVARDAMAINLNLDMIGRDPNNILYVSGTARQPSLRPLIAEAAAGAPVTLRMGYDDPAAGPDKDWTRDSDQWAFIEAGIPGLYFGVEDYRLHHHPDDDVESMTVDFYVAAVETIIRVIDVMDRAPAVVGVRP